MKTDFSKVKVSKPKEVKLNFPKKKKQRYKGFRLIPDTAGKICAGVYIKEDNSEIIIHFAWGEDLCFRPLGYNEKSV